MTVFVSLLLFWGFMLGFSLDYFKMQMNKYFT